MAKTPVFYDTVLGKLVYRTRPGQYDTVVTQADVPDLASAQTDLDTAESDLDTVETLADNLKTLANGMRSLFLGDYLDSGPGLAIGSTKANVANEAFEFHINGKEYQKAAVAAGTALSGDDVPQSLYGAWALDIGANKTIDIIPAAANATGYASAALAIAAIPAVAADHVRMGVVTAIKVDDHFLNSAPSLAIGTTKTAVAHAEFTHWHEQTEYTEPALAAGKALAGDTIPQNKYGAFRLEIGADETLDLVAASDNATGYNTAELALAGLPAVSASHVAVGTITVTHTDIGGFVPGTTELDAAGVTAAYTDGDLDGFFVPGTTELDDSEVTAEYTDGDTLADSFPAAVS